VNSIHDESGGQDKKFPTSYGSVSSVRNASFEGSPSKAIRVATGEQSKTPFARIKGELEHIDEDQAVKHFQKYLNHPDYVQVGYDPRRHGDFYDRKTMKPVTHSEHVVQIGPLVLAKNPVYGKRTLYSDGGVAHMSVGGHKELEDYIRQHEGQYGLHRLQRAQDEIHNLHGIYAPEALRQAFSGDNAKALMTMNPADFEKYAMQLKGNQTTGAFTPSLEDRIKGQKARKTDLSTEDYVKYLQSIGKFSDVPYLQIDKEEVGLPLTPFIAGHEGRHRNRAMASQGINSGLVVLHPRTELREPLPRRSREEYIDALRNELAMTGNMVKPQQDKTNPRPAIQMPDIYAKGGITHAHHLEIEERPL
jgi:hypothetical protein